MKIGNVVWIKEGYNAWYAEHKGMSMPKGIGENQYALIIETPRQYNAETLVLVKFLNRTKRGYEVRCRIPVNFIEVIG